MADIEFKPLFSEDESTIRARIESFADADIDFRPGEIFYDITTPIILEIERLWQVVNTTAATTFLPWSFGEYLDYKGQFEIGLARFAAESSEGTVTFIGDVASVIPSGTSVSTVAQRVDDPVYQFQTTIDEQVGMSPPVDPVTTTDAVGTGSITGTISYKVTFEGRGGETEAGPASTPLTVTAKNIQLTGLPTGPSGTTARKIYRSDDTGEDFIYLASISNNTATTYLDNTAGPLTSTDIAPLVNSTDRVDIPCQSLEVGAATNVGPNAISQLVDTVAGVNAVTNEAAFTGGADEENDDAYRDRLIAAVGRATGQGNITDYINWATSVEGVERASVIPQWNDANTVKVVLVGPNNSVVPTAVVEEVQALLDPDENGNGGGLAPIGAVVTVESVAALVVNVAATLVLHTGYSLDGDNGTTPVRAALATSVADYLSSLSAGDALIRNEVLAAIITTNGVSDVSALTLNGVSTNISISSVEVPQLGSFTITV